MSSELVELTRPIIGIENRTAQEVFDILCSRFRANEMIAANVALRLEVDRLQTKAMVAVDTARGLEAENARLLEALEPFAKAADNFDEFKINDDAEWFAYSGIQRATGSVGAITVADLRAARRARDGGGLNR